MREVLIMNEVRYLFTAPGIISICPARRRMPSRRQPSKLAGSPWWGIGGTAIVVL
jgi:hypothetical protein